jgi:hypothetical protein
MPVGVLDRPRLPTLNTTLAPHCPRCEAAFPRWLHERSPTAPVDYYHCLRCAHVWTVGKDGSGLVAHITPLPEPPDEER